MLNLRNTIEEAVYNRLRCQRKPADGAQGFYLSKKQRGISLNRLTALSHTGTSSLSSQGCSTSFRERVEILYDHYGQQVMLLDTLVSVFAEPAPEVPILDQFERVLRAGFRIIGDKPVLPIDNLRRKPVADVPTTGWNFHMASVTVKPKPSRMERWSTALE
jgi:hypothetical protein